MKQALKIEIKTRMDQICPERAPEFGCHGNRLITCQNLTTPNCFQANLMKSHEVGTL